MKRLLSTTLAAAVLAATFATGAISPAAAAPQASSQHTKSPGKADKQLAGEKRKVVSLIAGEDAALVRAIRATNRAALTVGGAEVLANIDADRLALAELKAAAQAATTVADVRVVGAQATAVRPEIYSLVVNGLRQAARFQVLVAQNTASIAVLGAAADAKELEGFDVAAVREALTAATLANGEAATLAAAALAKGVLLTAFSTTVEREAFSADVAGAGAALGVVDVHLQLAEDTLAAMVAVEEPVV